MGGQQNELYYNSLDQTAADFELSPVCINSDSELEIHFSDVSSVAAAELSPELASSNNSSESIVYGSVHHQVPMLVPTHDDSLSHGDTGFSVYLDVVSSIYPEKEDHDAVVNEIEVLNRLKITVQQDLTISLQKKMTVLRNLKMTRHLKIVMYLKHLMKTKIVMSVSQKMKNKRNLNLEFIQWRPCCFVL